MCMRLGARKFIRWLRNFTAAARVDIIVVVNVVDTVVVIVVITAHWKNISKLFSAD